MIVDTDVMIWALRGNDRAIKAVSDVLPFSITAVTYMELLRGMRNKQELALFTKQIKEMGITVEHMDTTASVRASGYMREYALSHSLELADALNAAIVLSTGETLLTANDKHYRMIPNIALEVFRP